jgi:serine phosphatase RsbU (regulator of sigma subunit)
MRLPGTQALARPVTWKARWLELTVLVGAAVVAAVCLTHLWTAPLELVPLLAVPPALAGVGAASVMRPLSFGLLALAAAAGVDLAVAAFTGAKTISGAALTVDSPAHALPFATVIAVVVVTAASTIGTAIGVPKAQTQQEQEEQIANVLSVAEAAQRAVLRPLPEAIGPLQLGVVYIAAAAEARVGGDLYEVASTSEHGIRLIIGDVRGKGLGAVEVAADIIGRFREVAHSVGTLNELAYRLDAGLSRRWGQYEEFVTALLAQIEPNEGRLTIVNCGHPPPILVSHDGDVQILEVRAPAPPLGLIPLGSDSGAKETFTFKPNDQLLLYTDGVTEARNASRAFYPLDQRIGDLAAQARKQSRAIVSRRTKQHANGSAVPPLLSLVRDDLLKHVGAPLTDDAALLLVRAPAAWPSPRPAIGTAAR